MLRSESRRRRASAAFNQSSCAWASAAATLSFATLLQSGEGLMILDVESAAPSVGFPSRGLDRFATANGFDGLGSFSSPVHPATRVGPEDLNLPGLFYV